MDNQKQELISNLNSGRVDGLEIKTGSKYLKNFEHVLLDQEMTQFIMCKECKTILSNNKNNRKSVREHWKLHFGPIPRKPRCPNKRQRAPSSTDDTTAISELQHTAAEVPQIEHEEQTHNNADSTPPPQTRIKQPPFEDGDARENIERTLIPDFIVIPQWDIQSQRWVPIAYKRWQQGCDLLYNRPSATSIEESSNPNNGL